MTPRVPLPRAPRDGARAQSDNNSVRGRPLTANCVGSLALSRMGARLSSALGRSDTAIDERHRPHALSVGGGPAATPPEALVPTSSPRAAPPRSWSSSPVRGSAVPRSSSSSPVRGGLDARLRQLNAEWATDDISEVLPNRLYIGTSAAAESLTLLRGLRIGGLVNCTENPNEPCADRVEAYLVIPVDDQPHINIGRHFGAAGGSRASSSAVHRSSTAAAACHARRRSCSRRS